MDEVKDEKRWRQNVEEGKNLLGFECVSTKTYQGKYVRVLTNCKNDIFVFREV